MKNMIGSVPAEDLRLAGMLEDVMHKLRKGGLTLDELDSFRQRKNPFVTVNEVSTEWERFYFKLFGHTVHLADVQLPKPKKGFDRLILVPKGLTMNQVVVVMREHFQVWLYTEDLDSSITINDRVPTETYPIRIRNRPEADEELKNLSANDLKAKNINGMTLWERLIFELKYYDETGKHLDLNNRTLCSGSRYSGGSVPGVYWSSCYSKLYVDGYDADCANSDIRARAVVTL